MPFIIRGVRMFSGWPDEEAPEGGLRRVHRLCGLTLGGDDLLDGGEFDGQDFSQFTQPLVHLRLVAVDGQCIQTDQQAIDRSSISQSGDACSRKLHQ